MTMNICGKGSGHLRCDPQTGQINNQPPLTRLIWLADDPNWAAIYTWEVWLEGAIEATCLYFSIEVLSNNLWVIIDRLLISFGRF